MDLEVDFMKGSGARSVVGIVTGAPVKELSGPERQAPNHPHQPPDPANRRSPASPAGGAGQGGARTGPPSSDREPHPPPSRCPSCQEQRRIATSATPTTRKETPSPEVAATTRPRPPHAAHRQATPPALPAARRDSYWGYMTQPPPPSPRGRTAASRPNSRRIHVHPPSEAPPEPAPP